MPVRQRRNWELKENEAVPEGFYLQRRTLLKYMGWTG